MVSWAFTYLQTHQVVYIKYIQLFVCQSYFNKVVFKKANVSISLVIVKRKNPEDQGWVRAVGNGSPFLDPAAENVNQGGHFGEPSSSPEES